jgi:DNA-binding transcriptional ArsR family regulator
MHLVPDDRAHLHTIDEHNVCDAIAGLGTPAEMAGWADRFAALADPTRLALLLCIQQVPDICVTDLAVAVGIRDPAVSQSLRLLRMQGLVTQRRDGRIIRYRIAEQHVDRLLDQVREHLTTPTLAGHAPAAH